MEDVGMVVIGYILQLMICQLDGLKPTACRPLLPQRHATRHECEVQADNIKTSFPNVQPEQFGLPKGTRRQIHLRCRQLYGDREA
jgi:hypothetical protein